MDLRQELASIRRALGEVSEKRYDALGQLIDGVLDYVYGRD